MDARFYIVPAVEPGASANPLVESGSSANNGCYSQELASSTQNPLGKAELINSPSSTAELLVLHVNVRDLRVLDRLPQLNQLISKNGKSYEVLIISETWFRNSTEAAAFNLDGFVQTNSFRVGRNGGGVSIYVRERWNIRHSVTRSSSADDVQTAKVVLSMNGAYMTVIGFYSRTASSMATLLEMLDEELHSEMNGTIILAGDANINILDSWSAQPYAGWLSSNGLTQYINGITRPSSGSCLDHIWVGCCPSGLRLEGTIIQTSLLADHYPVQLSIKGWVAAHNYTEASLSGQKIPRRVFSTANFEQFRWLLRNYEWNIVLAQSNPNDACRLFNGILYSMYDASFPLKLFLHKQSRKHTPWFDGPLRKARRSLDKLSRLYYLTRDAALKAALAEKRRNYRKWVKESCRSYHRQLYNKMRTRPKNLWKHVNMCTGRKTTKAHVPSTLTIGDEVVEGPSKVANAFCQYFSSIGSDTVAHLNGDSLDSVLSEIRSDSVPEFVFECIDYSDISLHATKLRGDLKGSVACVPSRVMKQCIALLLEPLHYIFNMSLEQGIFPLLWKKAAYVPIYKGKGDRNLVSNYRPIALTPFLAKLFEKCVKQQLERHLEGANFFCRNQHGFRAGLSTDTALCSMSDFIATHCEGGHAVVGVFLDVAKAFDSISHDIFLTLIKHFNFGVGVRAWLKSYLEGREISVTVLGVTSDSREVKLGVPQGSVLGPFIFIFYLNSLLVLIEKKCQGVKVVTYADDTSVLFQLNRLWLAKCKATLENYISYISSLFTTFKLALNVSKTKAVFFKAAQCPLKLQDIDLVVDGYKLITVECSESLGVTFSSDLKWKEHFLAVSRKCYGIISILARLRQLGHGRELLMTMYKALFEPVLFYGISVWGTTYNNVLARFQIVQNDALRMIFKLRRCQSVRFIFQQQELLTVKSAVKFKVLLFIYKTLREGRTVDFLPAPSQKPSSYNLRSAGSVELYYSACSSVIRQQSPEIAFAMMWNALPADIKSCKSLCKFKSQLKCYLLDRNFD